MKIKKQKKQKVEGYIVQSKPKKMGMNKKAGMLGMLGNVAKNMTNSLEDPKGGRMIKSGTDDYAKFYKILNDKYMSQEEKDNMLDELIGSGRKFEDLMVGAGIVKPGFFTGDYMSKLKTGNGIFSSEPMIEDVYYDAIEMDPISKPKTNDSDLQKIKSRFDEYDNYSKFAPRGPTIKLQDKAPINEDPFNLNWRDGLQEWEMQPRGKRIRDMSYPNDTGTRIKTKAERKAAKTAKVSKAKSKVPSIRKIEDIELKNVNDSKFTPPPAERSIKTFVDESKPRTSKAAEQDIEMTNIKPEQMQIAKPKTMEQMQIADPAYNRNRIRNPFTRSRRNMILQRNMPGLLKPLPTKPKTSKLALPPAAKAEPTTNPFEEGYTPPRNPFEDQNKLRNSRSNPFEENIEMKPRSTPANPFGEEPLSRPSGFRPVRQIEQMKIEDPAVKARKKAIIKRIMDRQDQMADLIRSRNRTQATLQQVRQEAQEVNQITADNILAAAQRGDTLDSLKTKSDDLLNAAKQYRRNAERLNGPKIPWKKLALYGGLGGAAAGAAALTALYNSKKDDKKSIPTPNITPSQFISNTTIPITTTPKPITTTPKPITTTPKPITTTPTYVQPSIAPTILPPTRNRYISGYKKRRAY